MRHIRNGNMFRKTYTVQQCTLKRWKLSEKHDLRFYHLPGKGRERKSIGENYNELMYLKYSSKFQEHFHGNYSVVQEHPLWDFYKNEQMCVADSFMMAVAQMALISLYPWILSMRILIFFFLPRSIILSPTYVFKMYHLPCKFISFVSLVVGSFYVWIHSCTVWIQCMVWRWEENLPCSQQPVCLSCGGEGKGRRS